MKFVLSIVKFLLGLYIVKTFMTYFFFYSREVFNLKLASPAGLKKLHFEKI